MDGVKNAIQRRCGASMSFVILWTYATLAQAQNAATRLATRIAESFIDPALFQIFGLGAVALGLFLWLFRITGPGPAITSIFVGALLFSVRWWVPDVMSVR